MSNRHEIVASKLYEMVCAVTWGETNRSWAYTSERLQSWDDCPAQPAMYLMQGDEQVARTRSLESISVLEFSIVVYQDTGKDTTIDRPARENDLIYEAIFDAFRAIGPDGRVTLGGLVHDAWIEGTVMKDGGELDGQGMLFIPVKVMLP